MFVALDQVDLTDFLALDYLISLIFPSKCNKSVSMKNPYKVLGLKQDASNSDIVKSQIKALKSKKYTMKEITEAQATLRKPAQRLAADFTFPILDEEKVTPLVSSVKSEEVNLDALDLNKYDSLK